MRPMKTWLCVRQQRAARFHGYRRLSVAKMMTGSSRGDLMTEQRWHGCGDVTNPGNRDGDRQDVVDQRTEEPEVPQERPSSWSQPHIATLQRIGVDSLPVGGDHDCQGEGNHNAHPRVGRLPCFRAPALRNHRVHQAADDSASEAKIR